MSQTPQSVTLQARGLYTHPNKFSLPQGALVVAENCVISREGIVEKRRGLKRYGTELDNPPSELFEYLKSLIVLDDTTLKYDSDDAGTWLSWTGSFSPPDSDTRMRALQQNLNFYFTTSLGVFKNDSLTGDPVRAGIPQGLDTQLSLTGTGLGWFQLDGRVGYRIEWFREDANGNEIRGAPSTQERITNPVLNSTYTSSGATITVTTPSNHGFSNGDTVKVQNTSDDANLAGSFVISNVTATTFEYTAAGAPTPSTGTMDVGKVYDIDLTFTIPDDIVAGDRYEIYRTDVVDLSVASPGDRHKQALSNEVTAADITAGTITVTDDVDEAELQENLDTNDNINGLAQAKARPPWCRFMAEFKGHVYYGDFKQPHFAEIRLLDASGLVTGTSTITLGGETYTAETAENIGNKEFQKFTSGLASENIRDTAKSLIRVINRGSSLFYAFYTSGINDAPGRILIEKREISETGFTITADSTATEDLFTPSLPVTSEDSATQNGVIRSRFEEPEAVPKLNTTRLGSKNRKILGLASIQDSLLIYKEDGLFIITGETDGGAGSLFISDDLDSTIELRGENTLDIMDNTAVGHTTQSVVRSTAGGSGVISRQVEIDLDRRAKFQLFNSLAFSVVYEEDRKLLFFLPDKSVDTVATVGFVLDHFTNAWTTWKKKVSAGIELSRDDRLYLGHAVDNFVLQERKSLTNSDFVDEDIPITIDVAPVSPDGTTMDITYSYTGEDLRAGFVITQGAITALVTAVTSLGGDSYRVTIDAFKNFEDNPVLGNTATASIPIDMVVEWKPEVAENPGTVKQFNSVLIYPERGRGRHIVGFRSDTVVPNTGFTELPEIVIPASGGWGSVPWGGAPWGQPVGGEVNVIRTPVHRNHQRCRALSIRYKNTTGKEGPAILSMVLSVRPYSTRAERLAGISTA